MHIKVPDFSLIVLIGPSGCGKSTFAAEHFLSTEVVSSDHCRGIVSDDENSQEVTKDAFELLQYMVEKRLANRRLTVVDATSVRPEDRKVYIRIARKFHALPVAIVLNPGERICQDRNAKRTDRQFGLHVVRNQTRSLKRGIKGLRREGFRHVFELSAVEDISATTIERQPLWTDKRQQHGPFDIIGDIHGCANELRTLLGHLGYQVESSANAYGVTVTPPTGRTAVFIGDLVDRGPGVMDVLRIVMSMVQDGSAYCVVGNHEDKFLRWLRGRKVTVSHGLQDTIGQLKNESESFRDSIEQFLDGLLSHLWLDDGSLCVAHAGLSESMIGRGSGAVRAFALYGETTGETDEFGYPVRHNWASDYRGKAMVVYGHTPVIEPSFLNNTVCIDTGCVFGGKLTALRYPENEFVSVDAEQTWFESVKPPNASGTLRSGQAIDDDMLDIEDVTGKQIISTTLGRTVTITAPNAAAALETMSRFSMNPKWLIYLPPTMSPSETSQLPGYLEHPEQAFNYYRKEGVHSVVCEEKHMGSRAVIVICRHVDAAHQRFGTIGDETGAVYTRTGRSFFPDAETTQTVLQRLNSALDAAGLWEELNTDWMVLDTEIMPWSAKAQALIDSQYAPVGNAAQMSFSALDEAIASSTNRAVDLGAMQMDLHLQINRVNAYVASYKNYIWEITSIDEYRVAPFHILASEARLHMEENHAWHMDFTGRIATANDDPIFMATNHLFVDPADGEAVSEAVSWWEQLTENGGEGMVVKPRSFIHRKGRQFSQPALKVRGKDYLRIIYGPEYDAADNLERLRNRNPGKKRSLASREFSLGYEALNRFIRREPLRNIHQCVFGVLALESEPVDPRL